ncbi:hypothetical protein PsorP6_009219 [Peronosclerospora sorghi]|uniref:Uncharacterized protein n=1 Tax=Peronosclerospora sorghi TaxID=230839 RepID=A0ACC0W2R4_9STRA|nr:hypothetical protein PsorP6_009219 [Peronosclerospora sorghi]
MQVHPNVELVSSPHIDIAMRLSPLRCLLLSATLVANCAGSTSEDTNAKNKSVVAHDLQAETSSAEERNGAQAILTMLETLPDDAMEAKGKAVVNPKTIILSKEAQKIKQSLRDGLEKGVKVSHIIKSEELMPEIIEHLLSEFLIKIFDDDKDLEMMELLHKWMKMVYFRTLKKQKVPHKRKNLILNPILKQIQDAPIHDDLVEMVLPMLWSGFIQDSKLRGLDNVPSLYHLDPKLQAKYKHAFSSIYTKMRTEQCCLTNLLSG